MPKDWVLLKYQSTSDTFAQFLVTNKEIEKQEGYQFNQRFH